MCWMYLNSLSGIYITPTRFILQLFIYIFFETTWNFMDFALAIWYNIYMVGEVDGEAKTTKKEKNN